MGVTVEKPTHVIIINVIIIIITNIITTNSGNKSGVGEQVDYAQHHEAHFAASCNHSLVHHYLVFESNLLVIYVDASSTNRKQWLLLILLGTRLHRDWERG